jgi:hypothetical protein
MKNLKVAYKEIFKRFKEIIIILVPFLIICAFIYFFCSANLVDVITIFSIFYTCSIFIGGSFANISRSFNSNKELKPSLLFSGILSPNNLHVFFRRKLLKQLATFGIFLGTCYIFYAIFLFVIEPEIGNSLLANPNDIEYLVETIFDRLANHDNSLKILNWFTLLSGIIASNFYVLMRNKGRLSDYQYVDLSDTHISENPTEEELDGVVNLLKDKLDLVHGKMKKEMQLQHLIFSGIILIIWSVYILFLTSVPYIDILFLIISAFFYFIFSIALDISIHKQIQNVVSEHLK